MLFSRRLEQPRWGEVGTVVWLVGALTALAGIGAGGCHRSQSGGGASPADIQANLEQLIPVTEHGLDLQPTPLFLTFAPLPSVDPWDHPAPGGSPFEVLGQTVTLRPGSDGRIHERYEARACPLREIWSCVELWATGRLGAHGDLACVGLQLHKEATVERRGLEMREADNCPFRVTEQGPAQRVVRGIEKAQIEHTQRQEADKYLDPKAE
jgi:hypothetical protein